MERLLNRVLVLMAGWMVQGCIGRAVDLSHPYNNNTLYWPAPGSQPYVQRVNARGQQEKFWYESNWFGTEEHSGTHLDAPAHFSQGQWRVDDIPPERLTGPGCVVDVRDKAREDPDFQVGQADFQAWERTHGNIPDGAILLVNTGWWTRYPNRSLVFNTPTPDNASTFHFPGYAPDGIRWLIANRKVHMLGIDTPSLDYGPSTDFEVHVTAFGANIPGLENVANLGSLPAKGFTVFVGVIKLEDGSGGPARILAVVPDVTDHCGPLRPEVSLVWVVSLFALIRSY